MIAWSQVQIIHLMRPLLSGLMNADFSSVSSIWIVYVFKHYLGIYSDNKAYRLITLALLIYGVTLIKSAAQYFSTWLSGKYSLQVAADLRFLIFKKYLEFGKAIYDKKSIGELVEIMNRSVQAFSSQVSHLQGMLTSSLLLIVYMGALLWISWKMTLVVLCVVPVLTISASKLERRIRKFAMDQAEVRKKFSGKLHETLSGLLLVQVFNKEAIEEEKFQEKSQSEIKLTESVLKWEACLSPVHEMSRTTTFLMIAFCISFLNIVSRIESAKIFVFFWVVQQVIPVFNQIQKSRLEILKSKDWNNSLKELLDSIDKSKVFSGSSAFKSLHSKIEIRNLSFSYTQESLKKNVLQDISFSLPKGKMLALVGPSGSGKSTMMNLLLRLYDCPEQSIYVDGEDIRSFDVKTWRRAISYVSQDVFLFNESVQYNLTYGCTTPITIEQIRKVTQKTKVDDFVKELPQGYDTIVGERGLKLSGGQRQRIAFARALLRHTPIIFLDEPTSALDSQTEAELIEESKHLFAGKTVFTIAHRLSTIQHADWILFLKDGTIADQGTFTELVGRNPFFSDFIQVGLKKAS